MFFSPTAMQRAFHHHGEWALADAAEEFGTMYCLSTIGTRSIEEMGARTSGPKLFQMYIHNDPALTTDILERCKAARFSAMALTVDTVVAGNRERDYHTGMTTPPKLTPKSLLSFALHPGWTFNYLLRPPFDLPNVSKYITQGSKVTSSLVNYLDDQIKVSISWDEAAKLREQWAGPFAVKGVMSVEDARRCVEIGATAIMISNHGGRQLDGSRSPFDQVSAIADAVGGQIELIVDGGVRRGTHVLKAIAAGWYLYALAGAGTDGVKRAARLMRDELRRDMRLMGLSKLSQLDRSVLAYR